MPIRAEWWADGLEPIGDAVAGLPVSNLAGRERRTVAIPDVLDAPELADPSLGSVESLSRLGTRAVLATPVIVFDRMIGVLALHRPEPGPWSSGDVGLAEAVARELGLALHTARLLDENERRLGEQSALLKAAQTVTSELELDAVLQRLVDEVAGLLRRRGGRLLPARPASVACSAARRCTARSKASSASSSRPTAASPAARSRAGGPCSPTTTRISPKPSRTRATRASAARSSRRCAGRAR